MEEHFHWFLPLSLYLRFIFVNPVSYKVRRRTEEKFSNKKMICRRKKKPSAKQRPNIGQEKNKKWKKKIYKISLVVAVLNHLEVADEKSIPNSSKWNSRTWTQIFTSLQHWKGDYNRFYACAWLTVRVGRQLTWLPFDGFWMCNG